jgi:hypothetical protein
MNHLPESVALVHFLLQNFVLLVNCEFMNQNLIYSYSNVTFEL